MIRSFVRTTTLGIAAFGAMCVAQAASATVYTFGLTSTTETAASGGSLQFSSTEDPSLTLNVTGYHINETSTGNSFANAQAATFKGYGLGDLYGNDRASNGTHQIDNVGGGVDFVALVFSQAVTLSQIDRVAYGLSGYGKDSDASFMAYSGSAADYNAALNETGFTGLDSGTSITGAKQSSNIWLVAASVNKADRNDGFKITNLKVTGGSSSPAAAVPEPASWAMMIAGFGVVGTALRRRRMPLLRSA